MKTRSIFFTGLTGCFALACDLGPDSESEATIIDVGGGKADTVMTPEFETPAKRVTRVNVTSNSGAISAAVVDSSPKRPTQLLLYQLPEGATCKDEIGAQGQTELTPVAESEVVVNPAVEYATSPGPVAYCIVIDNQNNVPVSMALAINTDPVEETEEPEDPECEDPEEVTCGPEHTPCDGVDDDLAHALGLNCDETAEVAYNGHADAMLVHAGAVGSSGVYGVREGEKMLILSTGRAADLLVPGSDAAYDGTNFLGHDPEAVLPAPLNPVAVSADGVTCTDDAALVGTGDCSNALQAQWDQGGKAYDYAEVRIKATVPDYASALSFDFAMFSAEYPDYYQSAYNDMFVAWLESESWTGNVSFDEQGNPMTLNAGFWNFKDAPNDVDCPAPCVAPELAGTAMEGHAGTKWLTTSAPVAAGEDIELVLAVFDLSDGVLDTAVLLDKFDWTCAEGPPSTCVPE